MRDDVPRRLAQLARDFDTRVRPRRGRYVREPAITNEEGVVYVPPPARNGIPWATVSGVAAAAVAGTWLIRRFGRRARRMIDVPAGAGTESTEGPRASSDTRVPTDFAQDPAGTRK